MTRLCAFSGCDNPASPKAAKGLCNSHYWQLHKGRPLTPLSYRRNRCEPWLEAHVDHEGDECLIWPFARIQESGMASVRYRGRQTIASRVMCELAHGKPPTPEHQAAHSCGNGHLGCMNPNHLRWATPKQNCADKVAHGTWAPRKVERLTPSKVHAIRELALTVSRRALCDMFDLSPARASAVLNRRTWSHV